MKLRLWDGRRVKVQLQFEPRDLWVGIFWQVRKPPDLPAPYRILHVYICVIPMLPLHITALLTGPK